MGNTGQEQRYAEAAATFGPAALPSIVLQLIAERGMCGSTRSCWNESATP
jgi:hypothetical protein